MSRWLLVAFALFLALGVAEARDANAPARFEGLSLGLDTGYGFGSSGDWCFCSFVPAATDAAGGKGGVTVAGELGYGLRLGPLFLEPSLRAGYADIGFSEICGSTRCNGELSWLAEAQVSAGIIVYDNIAVVGSLGVAAANVFAQVSSGPETSAVHDGVVAGAGVELGMSGGWRMGVEYRRYDMQGSNETPSGDVDIEWQTQTLSLVIHYELAD